MMQEDDKGVASAALSIIERLRKDMDVSKVRNATIISRSQIDALEAALEALRERACTPPPEAHVATSLLAQWREGAFETTADEAAQTALDEQAVGLDVAPIIEAWLTALATTEGLAE